MIFFIYHEIKSRKKKNQILLNNSFWRNVKHVQIYLKTWKIQKENPTKLLKVFQNYKLHKIFQYFY
jgi:hypothetical protein